MDFKQIEATDAFSITNNINEMFHCMDRGKHLAGLSKRIFIFMSSMMFNITVSGDHKRFGELFTTDAVIEISKAKVRKQGTQEIEGKILMLNHLKSLNIYY